MKKTVLALLLSVSVCTFFGCAPQNPRVEEETDDQIFAVIESRHTKQSTVKPEAVIQKQALHAEPIVAEKHIKKQTEEQVKEQQETKPVEMKVAKSLERNPHLSSVLKPLLPRRTTLMDAAAGFKNQRQFIAALHVSKNLGIPFERIKAHMTANEDRMSLNESLREIRPEMSKNLAKAEANKGEQQAKDDENQAKDKAKKAAVQEKPAANGKS